MLDQALQRSLRRSNDLHERLGHQEAKTTGPTLAEFYGHYQGLPGLRGLWYPGSLDQTGAIYDQSGQGRTLTYNGNPTLNLYNNLIPYFDYDGTGDYHSRADEAGLDITGTETTIAAARRGLTFGGWFWFDTLTLGQSIMGKYNGTGDQRSYLLFFASGTSTPAFAASSNGTAGTFQQANSPVTVVTGQWNFLVCRFTPSTEMACFANGEKGVNTTAINASIHAGTAIFTLGTSAALGSPIDGRCALAFLAASIFPDELINYLWQRSRPLLGV